MSCNVIAKKITICATKTLDGQLLTSWMFLCLDQYNNKHTDPLSSHHNNTSLFLYSNNITTETSTTTLTYLKNKCNNIITSTTKTSTTSITSTTSTTAKTATTATTSTTTTSHEECYLKLVVQRNCQSDDSFFPSFRNLEVRRSILKRKTSELKRMRYVLH